MKSHTSDDSNRELNESAVSSVCADSFSASEVLDRLGWSGAVSMRDAAFTPGFERWVNFYRHIGGEYSTILPKGKKKDDIYFWSGYTFIWVALCKVDVSMNWYCLLREI